MITGLVVAGLVVAANLVSRRMRANPSPAQRPLFRRTVLLCSRHAGSSHGLDRARAALLATGLEILDEIPVEHHERLGQWLSHPTQPLIVAAGGDGTVGTAVDYVAGTPAVLAVLPLGTSNDFARSLGLPTDPARAAQLLLTGKVSKVDAGRMVATGYPVRHFAHAASIGLNVTFARLATQASTRRRFGRLTYLVAATKALRDHPCFDCELCYDGHRQRLRLMHLSVINAPAFGGALRMRVPGSNVDDRKLEVIAVEQLPRRRLVLAALRAVLAVHRPVRGVHLWQLRRLRVHTDRPIEIALDGEICGALPAEFEVAGNALRVLTPLDFEDLDD
jgi:YegS/Rv2252/BmrU family lipid kinase